MLPPRLEIVAVSHDLLSDNTLTSEWNIQQTDFKSDSFVLQRLQGADWLILDTLFNGSGSFTESSLSTSENSYSYRIGDSGDCPQEYKSTSHTSILLNVDDKSMPNTARLQWSPYEGWEKGVDEYEIQLSVDSANWVTIGNSESTNYLFADDTTGFDYCFRVRAIEDEGNLAESYSNASCAFFIPELYAYNVITPNSDDKNESFVIKGVELYPNSRLVIFNRWGRTVFDQVAYQNNWRGSENGNELPNGVYYYVLELNEPRVNLDQINGVISILK